MQYFVFILVVCPISINCIQRLEIRRNERVCGVTKLRNEIYVLCRCESLSLAYQNAIRVFEDRNSFRPRKKIEIAEIRYPVDIGSSEKEDCLYVSDDGEKCVWKITKPTDDQNKITKWLTTDYEPFTRSSELCQCSVMVSCWWSIVYRPICGSTIQTQNLFDP